MARVKRTAVNMLTMTPRMRVTANPLGCAVAKTNSTHRREQGEHVRVEDGLEAKRVARVDRGAHGLAEADLLLDALEDDDVGVGRHPDGEDQAGDARQRHRDRDDVEEPPEQDAVDDEREVGDQSEEAVEDEHVQEDQDEAGDAGDERLVQGVLAERRRHLLLVGRLELDRQGAGVEDEGEILGLLDGHVAAADLRRRR